MKINEELSVLLVCQRCISVVQDIFNQQRIDTLEVHLGQVRLKELLAAEKLSAVGAILNDHGFELLSSNKSRTIERIKNFIIGKIHHSDLLEITVNWSDLLSDDLAQDYGSLSALFSSVQGITIEQYIIRQKIEKVKELLFYDELNVSEISFKLGYSSVQHLSTQFKKVTGQTPSQFKLSREIEHSRMPLDSVGEA